MKKHFYFDMPKETYEYIVRKGILRESQKEKTILDLCLKGKSIKEISLLTEYSLRTINRRKKSIYNKIVNCL